ncbi:hypothetical protein DPMN_161000 [Dreissena polymorpha]|uniref:Uncharacterized protein n=1 Tax=Dreissena polymorpha TaxID=45954 RepID=A0A9D4EMM8_DREPO|nr:hypothetical protein DPMN_161000 [Dreissena polymorpha]
MYLTFHFKDVSPSTIVQFLGLPDAVDILITFSRDQSNKTMKFRLEVYGCFRYMTTTAVPTVSVFTTVSSSSVLTTESSLASSSLTTEPSLTASQGITLGYVSSETTTASYSSEKTTPPSYTTVQTTLPPIVTSHTAYTTSYVTVYTTGK